MNVHAPVLEPVDCGVCGADDAKPWGQENGYHAVKCRHCGLVYVNPRPRAEFISAATRTGLHPTDTGEMNVQTKRSRAKIGHYASVIGRHFRQELKAPISWLDVGAGYGELVEAVQLVATPWSTVSGVEPMAAKARVAVARGLAVQDGTLADVRDRYDVVSLINVFSHVPDFRAFCDDLRAHLKPGGCLFLETGNGGDLERRSDYPDRLYLPDHLVFIGVEQMRRLLDRAGFDLVAVEEVAPAPLSRFKNLAKTVVDGRWQLAAALRSPFRSVFFKAKMRS
ncbi:MAG TPA: class I SAM-dependent methyltransferase [Caulobacteraceae bacterium]